MASRENVPNAEPGYISDLPYFQALCGVIMLLPILRQDGVAAFVFMAILLVVPFGIFFWQGLSARSDYQARKGPAAIGQILGCYGATVVGLPISFWVYDAVFHSHNSTAAIGLIAVPIFWAIGGVLVLAISWLTGFVIEASLRRSAKRTVSDR
jgi:hypothetical protein